MADFKFFLNRQGPKGEPGAKGDKGDNGNTPTFSDGINTPTVYTMQIDMGDGNVFETQNLKYPMRDDGGNYLRYDRTNSTVTLSAPNIADLQRTSGEVTLASVSDVENEDTQDTDAVSMELRNADQLALSNVVNRIDGDINAVDNKVDSEIQNRQNADTALSGRIDGLDSSKADKTDVYTKAQTDALLNGKANTVHTHNLSQITDAGSLAGKNTVDYSTEVTNKPTIGNGTITITQGGVTKGTFTTNQSGNSTIALDAGGGGGATYTAGPGITINQNDEISANVDNNTIVIDGNLLKANIPVVPTVNDATITITQGGVTKGTFTTNQSTNDTIALDTGITYSSGKAIEIDQNDTINLKTSIINAPLAYQDETGTDVKFQNRNTERYNGSLAGNGYNDSYWIIDYGTKTAYLNNPDVNFSNLLNSSSTIYAETRLTNGINISGILARNKTMTGLAYISLLGRYEQDESFTVIAAIGLNTLYDVRTYIRFFNNGNDVTGLTASNFQYNSNGNMYNNDGIQYYSINHSLTNLTICIIGSEDGSTITGDSKRTVTLPKQLNDALDTVTHIRVYPVNYNDSSNYVTLDESLLKVINPSENVTAGDGLNRLTIFKSGNNIFEAIPEAIKLKYDSNTLGVNANNELTVPTATTSNLGLVKPDGTSITINNGIISAAGSAPSNMVTTNTNQTITGIKTLNSNYTYVNTDKVFRVGSDGASQHIDLVANSYNSVPRLSIYNSRDGHNYGLELSNQMYNSKYRFWLRQPNGSTTYYDSKIYKSNSSNASFSSSDLNNFLLEKSMIDGTTITYNSSTGKISAAANPPVATSSSPGIVQPDNNTITIDSNGVISAAGGSSYTLPTATTSTLGGVKIDGTTITIDNNGVISSAGGITPSNMVTTDTSQDISGTKTFRVTTSNYTPTLKIAGYSSTGHNDFIVLNSNDYTNPAGACIGYAFNQPVVRVFGGTSGAYGSFYCHGGIYRSGSDTFTFWKDYAKNSKIILKNYQDTILDSSMLDGTYLKWDSTTNKITVDIQAIKDAIDALDNGSGSASQGPNLNPGGWD